MELSEAAALLRKPGQPQSPTFLELFFDLVFVFALTRVSERIVEDVTSQRRIVFTEAGQTLLLLLALLMVWFATTWITNLYDPQAPEIQLLVVVAMSGSLVMGVALPTAFGDRGLGFASAYVAIHLIRGLVLVPTLRGHAAQRRAAAVLIWFAVSAVPWIVGATFPESPLRGALWTVAIAIDYTGAVLYYRPPWIRRVPRWPIAAEYLSERYRQFFIVALGELILITGTTFSGRYFSGASTVGAFAVAFVTTVLLWRIYIYRAGELLSAAIAAAPDPSRLVRQALLAHVLLVAGIVTISAGYELVITHPTGHTQSAWIGIILGGPFLFLVGRSIFEYSVFARVSRSRLIGGLALAVSSPVMIVLPPLAVAVTAATVLAGVAISDALRARGRPPEGPSPPR